MTDTDKDLLEMAARAAGLKIDTTQHNGGGTGVTGFDLAGNIVLDWHNGKTWNPLTDDGDALRLAVKLGFDLEMHGCNAIHPYAVAFDYMRNIAEEVQPDDGDPYAATRRAIVRAAAEIGKCLP